MTQLALFASLTRWEIPEQAISWVGSSVVIGVHCVDLAWPWWHPWHPWND